MIPSVSYRLILEIEYNIKETLSTLFTSPTILSRVSLFSVPYKEKRTKTHEQNVKGEGIVNKKEIKRSRFDKMNKKKLRHLKKCSLPF